MAEQAKVPAIRFAGFTDPWEQRKLGELVTTTIGGGTPSTSNPAYWDGEIPWIQSSNVLEDTLFDVDIPKAITQKGLEESAAQIVPENSIAVVTHVGVGKLIYLPFQYSTSQDFISLCGLKGDARYTCYALWKRLQEDLHIVQGSAIKGITKEDLLEKNLPMPSVEEQAQIGVLFSQLDSLITLHQRKCDKLVIFKKSMLEKMFPKDGESVPEIRFAGFTDPWEQRKLEDIANRVTRKNEGESDLPLTISSQYGLVDQRTFFNNQVASKDMSGYYLLRKGEFAYNKSTSGDSPWGAVKRLVRYEKGCVSTLYICFGLDGADPDFLVTYYETDRWYKAVQMIAAEGARNHGLLNIAPNDFFDTALILPPSREEQELIGLFFARLDNLITLHQRKLELLQNVKKSLLDKMFV